MQELSMVEVEQVAGGHRDIVEAQFTMNQSPSKAAVVTQGHVEY